MSSASFERPVGTIYMNNKGEFAHTARSSGFVREDNTIAFGALNEATVFNDRGVICFPELKKLIAVKAREIRTVQIITDSTDDQ